MERHYDDIDFRIHCISSTEGQISNFSQAFYLQNLKNVSQALDAKGKNCLVFQVAKDKQIAIPVLRAAKLLWIYYCLKYTKEVHQLHGFLHSDWFACDSMSGEVKALGVSMVNFLLTATKLDLQISIAKDPKKSEVVRWLASEVSNELVSLWETKIDQVLPHTEDQDHYCLLSRRATLLDALAKFEDFAAQGKDLDAILISQDGNPEQQLLGILTLYDLPAILEALGLKRMSAT